MELFLSILFILGFIIYYKIKDIDTCNYNKYHKIDWGKVNTDKIVNNLSNSQVNSNILNGKYDIPTNIKEK